MKPNTSNNDEHELPHYRPSYCKITGKRISNVFKIRKECKGYKPMDSIRKCAYCMNLGYKRWQLDRRKHG